MAESFLNKLILGNLGDNEVGKEDEEKEDETGKEINHKNEGDDDATSSEETDDETDKDKKRVSLQPKREGRCQPRKCQNIVFPSQGMNREVEVLWRLLLSFLLLEWWSVLLLSREN